jgi:hypothetical protein
MTNRTKTTLAAAALIAAFATPALAQEYWQGVAPQEYWWGEHYTQPHPFYSERAPRRLFEGRNAAIYGYAPSNGGYAQPFITPGSRDAMVATPGN